MPVSHNTLRPSVSWMDVIYEIFIDREEMSIYLTREFQ